MKTRLVTVGGVVVKIPAPENMEELRELVQDDRDMFFLAHRGYEQFIRTYLFNRLRKSGDNQAELQRRAKHHVYHRQAR